MLTVALKRSGCGGGRSAFAGVDSDNQRGSCLPFTGRNGQNRCASDFHGKDAGNVHHDQHAVALGLMRVSSPPLFCSQAACAD